MAATSTSIIYSSQITHVGSGTSLAAAAIMPSSDVSTALAGTGNLARYPYADIALMIAPTASIASTSTIINLYRRDLNFDGSSDEPTPITNATTTYKQKYVGSFVVPNATTAATTHYLQMTDVPLPGGDCEFYIENSLGVNIPVGWTLKITPKSLAAQ